MRQGPNNHQNHQNHQKRARGRGGRKPHNMSNRTFDSNGPDVKIRGTAPHIYEKYLQLARDAQSSGDRVQGENYLQHAEHYYRVMVATMPPGQSYQPGYQGERNGMGGQPYNGVPGEGPQPDVGMRPNDGSGEMAQEGEDGDEDGDEDGENRNGSPPPRG